MRPLLRRNMFRFGLSLVAVYAALVICTIERHFVVVPSDPATFLLPFHHRCGLLLIATIVWCLLEAFWIFRDNYASA